MNAPICDFVRRYAAEDMLRLHMPGHKGVGPLGVENLDITEIDGADSLYEAQGVILESEKNASDLFGCASFYSTEGSSLCIRAMLYLALQHGKRLGRPPLVLAGRNAHKSFLSAAALLDLDVEWLYGAEEESYLCCRIDAEALEARLSRAPVAPIAVYITSPDYLGNLTDVRAIAEVCHRHGILLLVDNAHGAYLHFLPKSLHPMDLGADLCCASAHKTLPVITGGAYLHISPAAPEALVRQARNALALFGSTSPSYLILQSLDAANLRLSGGYREELADFCAQADALRHRLQTQGYRICGDEPLKITLDAKACGYTGSALAEALKRAGIMIEFADPDFLVLMLAPEIGAEGLNRLERALLEIPRRTPIGPMPPRLHAPARALSIREAIFSESEALPASQCIGRILSAATVGCPPAVPIVVCGERIDAYAIECFLYYGIQSCCVVKAQESP